MALAFMANRLKALLFILLGVVKRALCCFRRRRRASCDPIPLMGVGIVPNVSSPSSEERNGPDLVNWNSWDDNPVSVVTERSQQIDTVQQHIEMYRQQARHVSESEEQEPQPNFFEDMTPKITRQTKILLKSNESDSPGWGETVLSRLTLAVDPVSLTTGELETWEESPGWEDQAQEDWDPDAIIKEKRRLERQRRFVEQQQKRQQRDNVKTLGARLS